MMIDDFNCVYIRVCVYDEDNKKSDFALHSDIVIIERRYEFRIASSGEWLEDS